LEDKQYLAILHEYYLLHFTVFWTWLGVFKDGSFTFHFQILTSLYWKSWAILYLILFYRCKHITFMLVHL